MRDVFGASTAMDVTLGGLIAGKGRITDQVDATGKRLTRLFVYAKIKSGTAPTAGNLYKFYLVRDDLDPTSAYRSDGLGTVDADVATEPANAVMVGTIVVTADANKDFYGDFIVELPGDKWSLVVWNATDQPLNAASHYVRYRTQTLEG